MLKSEEKQAKTKVKINPKKQRAKFSYTPLSQFYKSSIVLTEGSRFRLIRISLLVLRTQRNTSCWL